MSKLYIFNPDHDLALAADADFFTAPPRAQYISHDLCTIPALYADNGSYILVPSAEHIAWVQHLTALTGTQLQGVTADNIPTAHIDSVEPWGWNKSIKHRLLKLGIPACAMPSNEDISLIRNASHRRTAATIISLTDTGIERPQELHSTEDIITYIRSHSGTILKAPWSGSGRGIYIPNSPNETPMLQWSSGIIRRQGSIVAEPLYNKVLDFAMEFYVSNEESHFAGYSVFHNDAHQSFDYGIIADDTTLEQMIINATRSTVSAEYMKSLQSQVANAITKLLGSFYSGFLGVDMMVFTDSAGNYAIHPCVEVNLRNTMGVVSHSLSSITCGSTAHFHVSYLRNTSLPLNGITPLTHIAPHSHFAAYIQHESVLQQEKHAL